MLYNVLEQSASETHSASISLWSRLAHQPFEWRLTRGGTVACY